MAKIETPACEPRIKIAYSKTDTLIKNFLEVEGLQEIDISNLVQLAIEYYVITGDLLYLGTVSSEDEHPGKLRKTIYIPKDSEANRYIAKVIEEGGTKKGAICDIISGGIEVGEHTQILDAKTYLIRKNELTKLKLAQKSKPVTPTKESAPDKKISIENNHYQEISTLKTDSKEPISATSVVSDSSGSEQKKKKKRVTIADDFIKFGL